MAKQSKDDQLIQREKALDREAVRAMDSLLRKNSLPFTCVGIGAKQIYVYTPGPAEVKRFLAALKPSASCAWSNYPVVVRRMGAVKITSSMTAS